MDPVLFADAEAALATCMRTITGSPIPAATKVPNPRPPEFIRVEAVGGAKASPITEKVLFTIECWAATDDRASELAQLVRALLPVQETIGGLALLGFEEAGRPASLPDPDSGSPRFTATYELTLRGTPINRPNGL